MIEGFDTTKYDNFSREQIDILYKTNPSDKGYKSD